MARSPKFMDSAKRDDMVRDLYRQGRTQSEIAREVGLSRQRIFQLLETLRVKKRVVPPRAERVRQIPSLIRQGLNGAAIARHFGISQGAVYQDIAIVKPKMSAKLAGHYHENRVAGLRARTGLRSRHTETAIDKRRSKVLPLIEKGMSLGAIGKKLGVTGQTIRNDLRALKVSDRIEQKVHANRVAESNRTRSAR